MVEDIMLKLQIEKEKVENAIKNFNIVFHSFQEPECNQDVECLYIYNEEGTELDSSEAQKVIEALETGKRWIDFFKIWYDSSSEIMEFQMREIIRLKKKSDNLEGHNTRLVEMLNETKKEQEYAKRKAIEYNKLAIDQAEMILFLNQEISKMEQNQSCFLEKYAPESLPSITPNIMKNQKEN